MYGYIAHYGMHRREIHAPTAYAAQQKAIELLKIPKSKRGLLSVTLAERPDGTQVTHSTASL